MQRPTSVTVIGWVFIGVGILSTLAGGFGLIVSLLVPFRPPATELTVDASPTFRVMEFVLRFYSAIAVVQLCVAVLTIVAGAAFLRLKTWARTALEVLTWLGLMYSVCFGVFWLWSLASMLRTAAPGTGNGLGYVMFGFGLVTIFGFLIPLIIILRTLRGQTVRNAVLGDPGA